MNPKENLFSSGHWISCLLGMNLMYYFVLLVKKIVGSMEQKKPEVFF